MNKRLPDIKYIFSFNLSIWKIVILRIYLHKQYYKEKYYLCFGFCFFGIINEIRNEIKYLFGIQRFDWGYFYEIKKNIFFHTDIYKVERIEDKEMTGLRFKD